MFEFEVLQDLKPNDEVLEIIKNYEYTVKNGKIKYLKSTKNPVLASTAFVLPQNTNCCPS